MEELKKQLENLLKSRPGRLVLSAPRAKRPNGDAQPYRRATLTPLEGGGWQLEKLTATQAFHQNLAETELAPALAGLLEEYFTQLTATAAGREHSLKLTKKGKVLYSNHRLASNQRLAGGQKPAPGLEGGAAGPVAQAPAPRPHNRQKKRPLAEGVAIPPLVDIGIMTAEGRVVAAMRDKYRQINRFVELVEDVLPKAGPPPEAESAGATPAPAGAQKPLRVVDFGCGKSYLSFVLYHYLTAVRGFEVKLTGLDLRADVVATCNAAAQKYGYAGLDFQVGDIAAYAQSGPPPDMVVTLHACDTATDHALAQAVGWGVPVILSVPCCQHELNAQLQSEEFNLLARYGLVKERTAALFTDAIRANLLGACGYRTQLVEFVDFEHTPKNIMIRAVAAKLPKAKRTALLAEVRRLCAAFSLRPTLLQLLEQGGKLRV